MSHPLTRVQNAAGTCPRDSHSVPGFASRYARFLRRGGLFPLLHGAHYALCHLSPGGVGGALHGLRAVVGAVHGADEVRLILVTEKVLLRYIFTDGRNIGRHAGEAGAQALHRGIPNPS